MRSANEHPAFAAASDPEPADGSPGAAAAAPRQPRPAAEQLMRTCANCGTELAERKCKLFCPRPGCGYFLSCADFY
ncbi:MAG: hypothetical protein ABI689_05115 [Thermoanaerobaculia bacterium]